MHEITVQSNSRTQFIDLTAAVQRVVGEQALARGVVTVFIPHTTAGIMINENADPDVLSDLDTVFDRMVPWTGGYRHGEGNTAAHAKAALTGSSVQVLVENGHLCLGTWQSIFFCEFDGPRSRKVWIGGSL